MKEQLNPIPKGYHSVTPYLVVEHAAKALEHNKLADEHTKKAYEESQK